MIGATLIFLTYSVVLAAPCKAPDCYQFTFGYQIEAVEKGVLHNGLERWRYSITKSTKLDDNTSTDPANTNFIALGLEAGLKVVFDNGDLNEACEGESTLKIGIGDCLRQWLKFTPNFNNGLTEIIFDIQPVGVSSVMPIAMKSGDDQENGQIIGPVADNAQIVENTFFINQSSDGRAVAVEMDRNGAIINAWNCDADCDGTPGTNPNFNLITTQEIQLEETFFCIPASDEYPANSTLEIAPDTALHCGYVEFLDIDSTIQFSNVGGCTRTRSGALFCW